MTTTTHPDLYAAEDHKLFAATHQAAAAWHGHWWPTPDSTEPDDRDVSGLMDPDAGEVLPANVFGAVLGLPVTWLGPLWAWMRGR